MGRKKKIATEAPTVLSTRCRQYPDPVLTTPVEAYNVIHLQQDPESRTAAEAMFAEMIDICENEAGIGLASNQVQSIEHPKRAIVLKSGSTWLRLLNPRIVIRSGLKVPSDERCLSVPGIMRRRMRDHRIKLQGTGVDGLLRTFDLRDQEAACAQHEIDHLNGVTLLS